MSRPPGSQVRPQSLGEEIANSISHGVGFMAAIAASPVLVFSAVHNGDAISIVGASIFAFTMVLMYIASTLYHALAGEKVKKIFRIFDHGAIHLVIAGTYTPLTLGVLRGAWGWTLFGLIWGMAFTGVTLKAVGGVRFEKLSMAMYLAMGWLIIIAAKRLRYAHFIWHVFVIAGTACHFIVVLKYAV